MNVESLKTELQQVLDNDVVLRKEFNELKRSLSDYRNQLIMRDEDCKRLQVTIDVLNTKLVVMERDNTNYKAELTSFKELRGTIKEKLQEKQDEIDARLNEIQGLKDDLNAVAAGYEQRIEELKAESASELGQVKEDYTNQINELKIISTYKENGLRDEYENRVSELTIGWADREQGLMQSHEEALAELKSGYENEIAVLKASYEQQIEGLSSGSRGEIDMLIATHQETLSKKEQEYALAIETFETTYLAEINTLRAALEEQRSTLTTNFNQQVETLRNDYSGLEAALVAGYDKQIEDLQLQLAASSGELTTRYQTEIENLKQAHSDLLNETIAAHENRVNQIVNDYEEKLSVTLIHSNAQNSKLNEELSKAQSDQDATLEKVRELSLFIEGQTLRLDEQLYKIAELETKLQEETQKFMSLEGDFESFKQSASLSNSEQVNELNAQIASLNLTHSDYVNELNGQIEGLNMELSNLGLLLEKTTNSLSATETELESKNVELAKVYGEVDGLKSLLNTGETELANFKAELQLSVNNQIQEKENEFQKLLAENSNLIHEIDSVQDRVEAQDAELHLLRSELEETKTISAGKTEDFKEVLANKNFEITNLEANNAALNQEVMMLKAEISELQSKLSSSLGSEEELNQFRVAMAELKSENDTLQLRLQEMQGTIGTLNESVAGLNQQIEGYVSELNGLKAESKSEEQEAFIDRLFKQIDLLNDERLNLLNEKEQMATQLLKMNDVVGVISQQVDSEKIDVTDLNNHRKNVILASNSGGVSEKSQMKEQINDLVREIDKCIALLSA